MVHASTMTHGEDAHRDLGLQPLSQRLHHRITTGKYGDPLCKNCSCTLTHKPDCSDDSLDHGILPSIHNGVGTEIQLRTRYSSNSTQYGTNGSGVTQQATMLDIINQFNAHSPPQANLERVSIKKISQQIVVYSAGPYTPIPVTVPGSLHDAISQLEESARWAICQASCPDQGLHLASQIQSGTAYAVSDGSLKVCFGTSAFILSGTDRRFDCRAVNIVPGPLTDGDSNRCELAGLYGIASITSNCYLPTVPRYPRQYHYCLR